MNENAKALYEDLLNSRLPNFKMSEWRCGMACCIGGEAEARMGISADVYIPTRQIADWLGLDREIAADLFYPAVLRSDVSEGGTEHSPVQHDEESPWAFMDTRSAYKATQPEAAEALKRACELSAMTPAIQRGGE